MDPETFVHQLKSLAPTKEQLSVKGLPESFIDDLIQSYICVPKKRTYIKILSQDTLVRLIQTYDCSKIEIGIIKIANRIKENLEVFDIGNAEQDVLAINKITLEIEVVYSTNMEYLIL